jgi:hypothetical protein
VYDLLGDAPVEHHWLRAAASCYVRLVMPKTTGEESADYPPRFTADADLNFSITIHSSAAVDAATASPEKLLRVRLLYSPEIISRQGAWVPAIVRPNRWHEITMKPDAKFKPEKGRTMLPSEEMKFATIDLREWFDLSRPGFYRLQLLPAAETQSATADFIELRFALDLSENRNHASGQR